MTWVVKRDDVYLTKSGQWGTRREADRMNQRKSAYTVAAAYMGTSPNLRIVRLKPRAKLDEAAIRRAERERIAAAVRRCCSGDVDALAIGDFVVLRANSVDDVLPSDHLARAIRALEWKP